MRALAAIAIMSALLVVALVAPWPARPWLGGHGTVTPCRVTPEVFTVGSSSVCTFTAGGRDRVHHERDVRRVVGADRGRRRLAGDGGRADAEVVGAGRRGERARVVGAEAVLAGERHRERPARARGSRAAAVGTVIVTRPGVSPPRPARAGHRDLRGPDARRPGQAGGRAGRRHPVVGAEAVDLDELVPGVRGRDRVVERAGRRGRLRLAGGNAAGRRVDVEVDELRAEPASRTWTAGSRSRPRT